MSLAAMLRSTNLNENRKALQALLWNVISDDVKALDHEIAGHPDQETLIEELYFTTKHPEKTTVFLQWLKYRSVLVQLENIAGETNRLNLTKEKSGQQKELGAEVQFETFQTVIRDCKKQGMSLEKVLETIKEIHLRPVLTAHPTQPKSRASIEASNTVKQLVDNARSNRDISVKEADIEQALRNLLEAQSVPDARMNVEGEVGRNVLYLTRLYEATPAFYRYVEKTLSEIYSVEAVKASPLLEIFKEIVKPRSWAGADADGNPNVTDIETKNALSNQIKGCVKRHEEFLTEIHDFCADQFNPGLQPFMRAIRGLRTELSEYEKVVRPDILLSTLIKKQQPAEYLKKAIEAIKKDHQLTLQAFPQLARRMEDFELLVHTFGVRFSPLDIRQDAGDIASVWSFIFNDDGLFTNGGAQFLHYQTQYRSLERQRKELDERIKKAQEAQQKEAAVQEREVLEAQQINLINALLEEHRIKPTESFLNHIHKAIGKNHFSPVKSNVYYYNKPEVLRELQRMQLVFEHGDTLQNWIIAGTESAVAVKNIQMLAAIFGAKPNIMPLFETRSALANATKMMGTLFRDESYKAYRGNREQLCMVGFSDSQRLDGPAVQGMISRAIRSLGAVGEEHKVKMRYFLGNDMLDMGRGGWAIGELHDSSEHTIQGKSNEELWSRPKSTMDYLKTMLMRGFKAERNKDRSVSAMRMPANSNERFVESWKKFEDAGCAHYRELFVGKYKPLLQQMISHYMPYDLMVKTHNFSSRATTRDGADSRSHTFEKAFDSYEGTGKMRPTDNIEPEKLRAISHVNLFETFGSILNQWYGVRQGINALGQHSARELYNSDAKFKEILNKTALSLEQANFDTCWMYFPRAERPKNVEERQQWAQDAQNASAETIKNVEPKKLLAMIHQEMLDTKHMLKELNLPMLSPAICEQNRCKKESVDILGKVLAVINRAVMREGKSILPDPNFINQKQMVDGIGAAYVGCREGLSPVAAFKNPELYREQVQQRSMAAAGV